MKLPIYLDNHATTPVDPAVFEAMAPYFLEKFGNASSTNHSFGREAERAVEHSRRIIAEAIGAEPDEIYFTGGATESINLAILGTAQSYYGKGRHIVSVVTEHSAVIDSLKLLEQKGFEITLLPVDKSGSVDVELVEKSLKDETILVSVMTANNETGSINKVEAIGNICGEKGILFHTDATQAIGKIPFNVSTVPASLASLTGHKIYGPKGVGVLFIRKTSPRIKLVPQTHGGGHENGVRSGTLNVPGIVGLGKAVQLSAELFDEETARIKSLRDRLYSGLQSEVSGIEINGSMDNRLPNNLNVRFKNVRAENIITEIRDIAVSTGAACSSASPKPSRILKALGLSDEQAYSSVRFGVGRFNTEEEIDYAVEKFSKTVKMLRESSPLAELSTK